MLKSMIHALTLMLALSFSTQAMAVNNDAILEQEQQPYFDEMTDGKLRAAATVAAEGLQKEAKALVKQIETLQDKVGFRNQDSMGVLKALGEKLMLASEKKGQIDVLVELMNDLESGTDNFLAYEKVAKNLEKIRKLNKEAKSLAR